MARQGKQALTRQQLQLNLNLLAKEAQKGRGWDTRTWTHQVKARLVRLGKRAGYQTCTNGTVQGARWDQEWLYDLVWVHASDDFVVQDVFLVAEIEWRGKRAIQQDFQKLLLARADCRVMIFDDDKEGLRDQLIEQARTFGKRRRGDRYLFASRRDGRFSVHEEII